MVPSEVGYKLNVNVLRLWETERTGAGQRDGSAGGNQKDKRSGLCEGKSGKQSYRDKTMLGGSLRVTLVLSRVCILAGHVSE